MENSYKRKKEPEINRLAILNSAAEIGAAMNWQHITFQEICNRTGLSKGAILYHFGNKQELMASLLRHLLSELSDSMADDLGPESSDTAMAFLHFVVHKAGAPEYKKKMKVIMQAIMSEVSLREIWTEWSLSHVAQPETTNTNSELLMVQLIADGLWCSEVLGLYNISTENKMDILNKCKNLK